MKLIEVHVHGRYLIKIEDNGIVEAKVEQSLEDMLDYNPDFEIEGYNEIF